MKKMLIGELAQRAGVGVATVRHYEKLGLLQPQGRSGGGTRLYAEDQLRRLAAIRDLKNSGLALEDIGVLFGLSRQTETGGALAGAAITFFAGQQQRLDEQTAVYRQTQQKNQRALEILAGCLDCAVGGSAKAKRACLLFEQHPALPQSAPCPLWNERRA